MLSNELLLNILLILGFGKLLGTIAERFGYSSIIGELLIGILLGPMALGIIHPSNELDFLANLGIIFMLFIMGLSIDVESVLKANARRATNITLAGALFVFSSTAIVVLIVGTLLGQDLYLTLAQACLLGVGLTSTSTAIGFKFLSDMGDRFSNVFKTLVAVEITDGIFSIMLLAIFLSVVNMFINPQGTTIDYTQFLPSIGWSSFKLFLLIIGFMIFVIKFGGQVTDWLLGLSRKSKDEHSVITLSLIVLFAVAALSDWLQLTFAIGAFLAGAILAGSPYSETVIAPKVKALGYGLFIPIFFAYTGIQMDFGAVFSAGSLQVIGNLGIPIYLLLFIGLLVGVMGGKYMGTILACKFTNGIKDVDAKRIAYSLVCIGEDTLVIAQIGTTVMIAENMPIVSREIFTVLGLLIITSSIITPYLLKRAYDDKGYASHVQGNTIRHRIRSI